MTSLGRELGAEQDIDAFATSVRDRFAAEAGREIVEVAWDVVALTAVEPASGESTR